jgi:integrase
MTTVAIRARVRTEPLSGKGSRTTIGYQPAKLHDLLSPWRPLRPAHQVFINQKRLEEKKQQALKNLKWGLNSIFESAINFGYISVNPAPRVNLPPKEVKEKVKLPTPDDVVRLIEELPEPYSTMVYLVSVSSIRPEELAFK